MVKPTYYPRLVFMQHLCHFKKQSILAKAAGELAPHTCHVVPYGSSIKYPNLQHGIKPPYLHCTEQDIAAPQVIPKQSLSILLILIMIIIILVTEDPRPKVVLLKGFAHSPHSTCSLCCMARVPPHAYLMMCIILVFTNEQKQQLQVFR